MTPNSARSRLAHRRTAITAGMLLLLSSAGLAACGGDGDEDAMGAAELRQNIERAGYKVERAPADQLPSYVGGAFVTNDESGYESALFVTGKGLSHPDKSRVDNVVTVLVYKSADDASEISEKLGTEKPARKHEGNRIYLYSSGLVDSAPKLPAVMDAANGS